MAFWPVSSFLGNAFAAIVVFGMYAVVPDEAMASWGWRIPFLLCGPIGLIAVFVVAFVRGTARPAVLVIDTYELLGLLDAWLRWPRAAS